MIGVTASDRGHRLRITHTLRRQDDRFQNTVNRRFYKLISQDNRNINIKALTKTSPNLRGLSTDNH